MRRLRLFLGRVGRRDIHNHHVSPPLGLLCLAAYVREHYAADVRLVDQRLDNCSNDELVKQAIDFGADVVGFSTLTPSAFVLPELTAAVRAGLPSALIALGGAHVSGVGFKCLEECSAHVAVAGEGELTFARVIDAHLDGRCFEGIPGVIWRDDEGNVIENPGQGPFVEDIDSLPMPAYDLLEVERYWKRLSLVMVPRRRYLSLMTSRGCPFQCNFCHKVFGKRFRGHSPERVVAEVEYFTRKYGVADVEFLDDVFNYDYDRALEICELIQKRVPGLRLALPNGVRTDILSEELTDAMVAAGLYFASFALDAGSPRIQRLMGKNLNIPAFLKNLEYATQRGVFANGHAMLGFPEETAEEIQLTIDTMCESAVHVAQFHTVTPFPGTPLYEIVAERMPELLAGLDYSGKSVANINVNLSAAPDEVLTSLQRKANLRFYMNPRRIWRLVRNHPRPHYLGYYLPMFLDRATKGLL